ncbi:MAG TPA: GAF domain-containing protein [Acidimicrobiales bacterium]|nr:GAF domain-containing protein [Acidimicrobiales bacterium]
MGISAGLLPKNEEARLAAVRRYGILDTESEEVFDRLTALAARLMDAPISMMSIVDSDRVWVKSRQGTDVEVVERAHGICSGTILTDEPYVISDATVDERWQAIPLVTDGGLRFYAGAPLRTADGYALGALMVADVKPRDATAKELETLQDLASVAMHQLDLRLAALGNPTATDEVPDAISWEDPPQRKVRPPEEWAPLLAQVLQRPGHWAKLRHYSGETSAYRAAAQLRDRDDLPEGHWEFLARRSPEGGSDLFARVSAADARDRTRRH